MAIVNAETAQGFQGLPALRQLGLMIGLAGSVALGVAVVLWSQEPNYTVLYGSLGAKDAGEVVEALKRSEIKFNVDPSTGSVMVESSKIHTARMELAKSGLPEGGSMGFELLDKAQGFGTSQFIETKRYQRALEGEISRTISELRNVNSARVHLAIPKRSVFLRDRTSPTASVMVDLYSGRKLNDEQIAAIVHMVSSSVPHLTPEDVTILDQRGNLLSSGSSSDGMAPSSGQFSYNRKLEQTYKNRIHDLLEPVVGAGKVRATINADLDFTVTERTEETYNPDLAAVRSEQTTEDVSSSSDAASGVPGALSNQPPKAGSLRGAEGEVDGSSGIPGLNGNSRKSRVRNFELDKTVSHTKLSSGNIRRLSVAVVVDNKQEIDEDGEITNKPWTDAEMKNFTSLVKDAVGFNAQRGDSINIINSAFIPAPELEEIPEQSLLEKPWVWDVAKQVVGALGVLLVIFGVLKPIMRSLAEKGVQTMEANTLLAATAGGPALEGGEAGANAPLGLPGATTDQAQLAAPGSNYEQQLEAAQSVVKEDPKRVAQVVKNWVTEDA